MECISQKQELVSYQPFKVREIFEKAKKLLTTIGIGWVKKDASKKQVGRLLAGEKQKRRRKKETPSVPEVSSIKKRVGSS